MADLTTIRDWRALLAPIVENARVWRDNDAPWPSAAHFDLLNAVADLLTLHARARRDHNEDMRAAQRDARDAFQEGRSEGRAAADRW